MFLEKHLKTAPSNPLLPSWGGCSFPSLEQTTHLAHQPADLGLGQFLAPNKHEQRSKKEGEEE